MVRNLTFMIMLFLLVTQGAYSEEIGGDNSRGINKFLGLMSQAGMSSATLREAAYFVDERIDDKKFRITEHNYAGFNMSLTHDVSFPDYKDLELRIAPENSNYLLTGSAEGVMVTYQIPLGY